MKTRKNLIRITLSSLVLMVLFGMFNFSQAGIGGDIAKSIIEGIVGVLGLSIQLTALLIFSALETLTIALTAGSGGSAATMGDVVFNKCGITSANFFPAIWVSDITKNNEAFVSFSESIGKYYTIMRSLAIAILLGVLLYVGIRMAISTVAEEQAKYKKMFFDWAVSLVLVFVLHYIIIFVFYANNVLVETLSKIGDVSEKDGAVMAKLAAGALIPRYRVG